MNFSFSLIAAILTQQENIEELPDNSLIGPRPSNHPCIEHQLNNSEIKLLIRFQTVLLLELDKIQRPKYEATAQVAKITGTDFATTAVDELNLMQDTQKRCEMLERLIIEAMRSFLPSECEHLNVRYRISLTGPRLVQIARIPVEERFGFGSD